MWLLTRNGYFVGCLEASKISSNGFALDFFPLTVSPTGLKIFGGVLCFCQIWLLPGGPWSCRFWRVEGLRLKSMSVDNMRHQAFGKMFDEKSFQKFVDMASFILGTRPNKKVNLQTLQITSWWTGRPWLKPPLKTLRGDMILRPIPVFFEKKNWGFLRVPQPGNMATSVSTTKMTVSSWFLIGWISHPWKTLMFFFFLTMIN